MPSWENGLATAFVSIVSGYITFLLLGAIEGSLGPAGVYLTALLAVMALIATIELARNMNYWSIGYLAGWLLGYLIIGTYLLSWDELLLSFGVGATYLIVKGLRKVK